MGAFKESILHTFEMPNLGSLHYFMGLEVIQDSKSIFIYQMKYANDLLEKFRMVN